MKSRKLIKNTSKIVYFVIKDNTERNRRQRTECLRAPQGPLPVKFLAIPSELGERKSQLKRYKDILLTGNQHKIS